MTSSSNGRSLGSRSLKKNKAIFESNSPTSPKYTFIWDSAHCGYHEWKFSVRRFGKENGLRLKDLACGRHHLLRTHYGLISLIVLSEIRYICTQDYQKNGGFNK